MQARVIAVCVCVCWVLGEEKEDSPTDCGRPVPTSPRVAAEWSKVYALLTVDSLLLYLGTYIGQ